MCTNNLSVSALFSEKIKIEFWLLIVYLYSYKIQISRHAIPENSFFKLTEQFYFCYSKQSNFNDSNCEGIMVFESSSSREAIIINTPKK